MLIPLLAPYVWVTYQPFVFADETLCNFSQPTNAFLPILVTPFPIETLFK